MEYIRQLYTNKQNYYLLGRGDFGYICVSHRFINKSETVVLLRKEEVIITYSDGILIW